jgi:ABC-type sugar transport system permease subunit
VSEQKKRWPFRWVVAIVAIAIIVNVAILIARSRLASSPAFGVSPRPLVNEVFSVTPVDAGRLAVATLGNEITVREQGEVVARTQMEFAVGGLAFLPERGQIAVGTANGRVYTFDQDLNPVGEAEIRGRVLGLSATPDGQIVVSHGVGAYGDRFYITLLDAGLNPLYTHQAGFLITAVGNLGSTALYGTDESRVDAVGPNGEQLWESQLRREITAVNGWDDRGIILAGDEVGNAYMLDENGELLWEQEVTTFRIVAVQPVADNLIVFGDSDGSLFLVDGSGQLLLSEPSRQELDTVTTIYPLGNGRFEAVRQSGQAVVIDPAALQRGQIAQAIPPIWYALNGVLLISLALALISAIERWQIALGALLRRMYQARMAYLFLLPSLALILTFSYYTTATALYYSMTDWIPGRPLHFVGLDNFGYILAKDAYFWDGFGNMLIILATSTFKVLSMPMLVAMLVYHLRSDRARYWFRTAMLLPSVVPGMVLTMVWKMMYDPGGAGFINAALRTIGLEQFQRAWLGDERTALWAIIFAGFPWVGAFGFLVYLGGMININTELFDAVAIDGANWWTRLWRLEWPLLAPQRNLLLFFTYLGAIQSYAGIWIYTQGGPGHATYVPALQLFLNLSQGMRIGYASAIGFTLFLMVLVVTILNRRIQQAQMT